MDFNITFNRKIVNKIKIGIFTFYLENGGRSRITSFLLNYLNKVNFFNLYLFTNKNKGKTEYFINENIKRILINDFNITILIKNIIKKRINIFIYQFSDSSSIKLLNGLSNIKIIYYQHQSIFFWIYSNYTQFKSIYKIYKETKYIISLIHLENDYIFQKWGIKSILMNNFITFKYNSSIPIDLNFKEILMIGRADSKYKRFDLGIQAMEYIIKEIPEVKMKIITNTTKIDNLKKIINNLNLQNKIEFIEYTPLPEIYFRNISLNIITSISESFSLVLSETKIYGIPNIVIGLDYISTANGGIIIIYDDFPETIAKETIKILINNKYRNYLGREARRSMKKFENKKVIKNWIKLILLIYFDNDFYEIFKKSETKISEKYALNILKKQIMFFKERKNILQKINIKNIENFTFLENIKN